MLNPNFSYQPLFIGTNARSTHAFQQYGPGHEHVRKQLVLDPVHHNPTAGLDQQDHGHLFGRRKCFDVLKV